MNDSPAVNPEPETEGDSLYACLLLVHSLRDSITAPDPLRSGAFNEKCLAINALTSAYIARAADADEQRARQEDVDRRILTPLVDLNNRAPHRVPIMRPTRLTLAELMDLATALATLMLTQAQASLLASTNYAAVAEMYRLAVATGHLASLADATANNGLADRSIFSAWMDGQLSPLMDAARECVDDIVARTPPVSW